MMPQPNHNAGSLAERIYNELSKYMDVVDMAEFVANNPDLDSWLDKLAEFKDSAAQKVKSPYRNRWVTDFLVKTPKGTYKEYKEAE